MADPLDEQSTNGFAAYLYTRTVRHDEHHISTWLDARPDLRDRAGELPLGLVAFTADVATGVQSGLSVLDRDLWIVTTDLALSTVAAVAGPVLRVDAEVVRSGATTVVSTFTAWDDDAGTCIGAGTATSRPFEFDFDRRWLQFPVGKELTHGERVHHPPEVALVDRVGIRPAGEDGTLELDLRPWLMNPWGIMHGGAVAYLLEQAALAGVQVRRGERSATRATSMVIRYLAPAKVGPVQARPTVLTPNTDAGPSRTVVSVELVDQGADARRCAVATVEVRSAGSRG